MTSPEHLRDTGMAQTTNAADSRIVAIIDALITLANETGKPWSANLIRDQIPACNQHLVGARVRAAAMRRPVEMVAIGRTKSTLASTRCAEVKVWQGVTSAGVQVAS